MPVRALIFDLDDTLVDTFSLLIVPLEAEAATRMVAAGELAHEPDELLEILLELRQRSPVTLEVELQRRLPAVNEAALAARRKCIADLTLERLVIDAAVRQLLQALNARYRLFLLTAGDLTFQEAKVAHLTIAHLFEEIAIIPDEAEYGKEKKIRELLQARQLAPAEVLVVGNRLDKEIAAGQRVGAHTVWVRHGEGAALASEEAGLSPTYIIDDILALRDVLASISLDEDR